MPESLGEVKIDLSQFKPIIVKFASALRRFRDRVIQVPVNVWIEINGLLNSEVFNNWIAFRSGLTLSPKRIETKERAVRNSVRIRRSSISSRAARQVQPWGVFTGFMDEVVMTSGSRLTSDEIAIREVRDADGVRNGNLRWGYSIGDLVGDPKETGGSSLPAYPLALMGTDQVLGIGQTSGAVFNVSSAVMNKVMALLLDSQWNQSLGELEGFLA